MNILFINFSSNLFAFQCCHVLKFLFLRKIFLRYKLKDEMESSPGIYPKKLFNDCLSIRKKVSTEKSLRISRFLSHLFRLSLTTLKASTTIPSDVRNFNENKESKKVNGSIHSLLILQATLCLVFDNFDEFSKA